MSSYTEISPDIPPSPLPNSSSSYCLGLPMVTRFFYSFSICFLMPFKNDSNKITRNGFNLLQECESPLKHSIYRATTIPASILFHLKTSSIKTLKKVYLLSEPGFQNAAKRDRMSGSCHVCGDGAISEAFLKTHQPAAAGSNAAESEQPF